MIIALGMGRKRRRAMAPIQRAYDVTWFSLYPDMDERVKRWLYSLGTVLKLPGREGRLAYRVLTSHNPAHVIQQLGLKSPYSRTKTAEGGVAYKDEVQEMNLSVREVTQGINYGQ